MPKVTEGLLKVRVSAEKDFFSAILKKPENLKLAFRLHGRRLLEALGHFLVTPFPQKFQNQRKGCQILTSRNNSADSPDPPETPQGVRAGTYLTTRAGGQDDVSSNKLPQIR